jgi:hypothetical protein
MDNRGMRYSIFDSPSLSTPRAKGEGKRAFALFHFIAGLVSKLFVLYLKRV